MRVRPADAAAGTDAPAVGAPEPARARPLVRVTLITLAAAALLATLAVLTYALAAASVPERRATLENLVHAETGLDVRFSELRLRWGWYGPEAVFRRVQLREPGAARALLTAPQLVLGVDLWRMLRSGDLAISRIALVDPDIDLTERAPVRAPRAPAAAPATPARLLARWRGTRIDVTGGTLRASFAGVALDAGIRQIQLRRAGSEWSAAALLAFPEALGTTAELGLRLHGDAQQAADLAGRITLSTRRLQLAGWRSLLKAALPGAYLPGAGSADLTMTLDLAPGGALSAQGSVTAAGLEWPAVGAAAGLALHELQADWRLQRDPAGWHLGVEPLELGAGSPAAAVAVEAAADGSWVRGRLQRAPAAVLAGLVRGALPQLRLSGVDLAGTVREARFDWSAARAPNERLLTGAELDDLSVTPPGRALTLAGLSAHLSGRGASLEAALDASDARATLAADPTFRLEPLGVHARLTLVDDGHAWQVSSRELEIRHGEARLVVSGALTGLDSGTQPRLDARATLSGARVELVRRMLGAPALAALGSAAGELTSGQIERAELVARGPLDEPLPWRGAHREFTGSLELRGASLAGSGDWPDLHGLAARIDWRAARVRVRVDGATAGGFRLTAARAEWDARAATLTHLAGRLSGDAGEALAWLRDHPRLEAYAPGVAGIALSGGTQLDFELSRTSGPRFATRLAALLDGAQLRPVAGLPAIEALRGTLTVADGHLRHSTLAGRWLGGPITLSVGERRERGAAAVAISGKGVLEVPAALAAAGLRSEETPLQGNAEWSADLRLLPGTAGARPSWRARVDSSLAGVASRLPEPLGKAPGSVLALHIELLGTEDAGVLRVALGERLRGLVALSRRGELWRVERGAVNLGGSVPAMPAAPVLEIGGAASRLDLPGYVLLWRQLARDSTWPALEVELTAAELLAAGHSFADVRLAAQAGFGPGQLRLESPDIDALVRWPGVVDGAHPVSAHIGRLDLERLAGSRAALAAAVAALGIETQLSVADLRWQGGSLGALEATLGTRADALELRDVRIAAADGEARGTLRCQEEACRATFSLASRDAAATLGRLGFRADLRAARFGASGQLEWPTAGAAALAAARGELHVELEDGLARGATPAGTPGRSLGLLAAPALVAGLGLPQLPFARLSADFKVAEGEALTSNLHLDGDTEILMRGRIGLAAHDYDAQLWVLKGEERLPAAVRRLGAGPRVAALWMSLRELVTGEGHEHATLRLRGTWDDPMVSP
jgi:uncharacterized protein YhdP